jgi:hypothetical protein
LTSLDISDNDLTDYGTDMSGKSREHMLCLASSFDNHFCASSYVFSLSAGVTALADAISRNGAISTVIVNTFPLPIQDIKCRTELDFSGKQLKVEDAIIIAALIPSNVSRTIFPRPCYH